MSKRVNTMHIRLRVKEVAEAKGIVDPVSLAEISTLPISIAEALWNRPTENQDLETIVAVAIALKANLDELVEVTIHDKDYEQPLGSVS